MDRRHTSHGRVHQYVCTLFRASGTARRIVLKFGAWLLARDPLPKCFTKVIGVEHLNVRIPFHIPGTV